MPLRYTCRLLVVRSESGKLKVRYGWLGEDFERLLVIHGPGMIFPPEEEMTDEEFRRWELQTANGTGYTYSVSNTPEDAPLVEAKKTYEDEIPLGSVRPELLWAENESGERTLAVRVTSEWDRLIPQFSLATDCTYDAPQPEKVGDVQTHVMGESGRVFHPMDSGQGGDLWPGVPMGYYLDLRMLSKLRSRAASLSTESHWISLRTDGYEFDRIPGEMVAAFLDKEEEVK